MDLNKGSYEMDLIVTDEDSSEKICILWIIHNDHVKNSNLENE